jgi:hypothetical protein
VQVSANAPGAAVTDSLKVTLMFAFVGTSVAPFGGVVAATNGDWSVEQKWRGDSVVRGLGAPAVKSALFVSLSWQPPSLRKSAEVFESPGAGAPSE